MSEILPLIFHIAQGLLGGPTTSCDVERCFFSLKWVYDEPQQDMKDETHKHTGMHVFYLSMDWWSELTLANVVLLCFV